eukprot:1498788-Pleurochrysis_carterae.AAC.2
MQSAPASASPAAGPRWLRLSLISRRLPFASAAARAGAASSARRLVERSSSRSDLTEESHAPSGDAADIARCAAVTDSDVRPAKRESVDASRVSSNLLPSETSIATSTPAAISPIVCAHGMAVRPLCDRSSDAQPQPGSRLPRRLPISAAAAQPSARPSRNPRGSRPPTASASAGSAPAPSLEREKSASISRPSAASRSSTPSTTMSVGSSRCPPIPRSTAPLGARSPPTGMAHDETTSRAREPHARTASARLRASAAHRAECERSSSSRTQLRLASTGSSGETAPSAQLPPPPSLTARRWFPSVAISRASGRSSAAPPEPSGPSSSDQWRRSTSASAAPHTASSSSAVSSDGSEPSRRHASRVERSRISASLRDSSSRDSGAADAVSAAARRDSADTGRPPTGSRVVSCGHAPTRSASAAAASAELERSVRQSRTSRSGDGRRRCASARCPNASAKRPSSASASGSALLDSSSVSRLLRSQQSTSSAPTTAASATEGSLPPKLSSTQLPSRSSATGSATAAVVSRRRLRQLTTATARARASASARRLPSTLSSSSAQCSEPTAAKRAAPAPAGHGPCPPTRRMARALPAVHSSGGSGASGGGAPSASAKSHAASAVSKGPRCEERSSSCSCAVAARLRRRWIASAASAGVAAAWVTPRRRSSRSVAPDVSRPRARAASAAEETAVEPERSSEVSWLLEASSAPTTAACASESGASRSATAVPSLQPRWRWCSSSRPMTRVESGARVALRAAAMRCSSAAPRTMAPSLGSAGCTSASRR